MIREIDALGRVVIPKEMRKACNIDIGSRVKFRMTSRTIIISKYSAGCHCCDKVNKNLVEINDMKLCPKCLRDFYKKYAEAQKGNKEND